MKFGNSGMSKIRLLPSETLSQIAGIVDFFLLFLHGTSTTFKISDTFKIQDFRKYNILCDSFTNEK